MGSGLPAGKNKKWGFPGRYARREPQREYEKGTFRESLGDSTRRSNM